MIKRDSLRKFFAAAIPFLSFYVITHAQSPPPLHFEHYTSENGLSHSNTNVMMIDRKGFLWVGAFDGLNRFDGYDYKFFGNNPFDTTTLSRAWPWAMAEDSSGIIWISTTIPQGLNRYDPVTGKFFRYSDKKQYKKILPTSLIDEINVDAKGNLWLSTHGEGLIKFNPANNTTIRYAHNANDSASIADNYPNGILIYDSEHFYVATTTGFDVLNPLTGNFQHFKLTKPYVKPDADSPAFPWCKDHKGTVWLATKEGLYQINPRTQQVISFHHDENNPFSLTTDLLHGIAEDPDGKLWITSADGLNVFDPSTNKVGRYLHDEKNPASLSTSDCYSIVIHISGKMFVQTAAGIDAVNLQPIRFQTFLHDLANPNSVSDNSVGEIFRDKDNNIFVNTSHGLNVFNPKTRTFHLYQPDERVNNIFRTGAIFLFTQDREGNYWIVTDQNKIMMFNPEKHDLRIFHPVPGNPDSLSLTYVWDIFEDSRGIYWFNGPTHSCSFNPATGKITKHLIDPKKPESDVNGISMFNEYNGKIWGNSFFGLLYYDEQLDTFIRPEFHGHKTASLLQENWIFCAVNEDENKFWLGTEGQGVFFIDVATGNCVNISTADGLPDNVIMSITKDIHQNLWIATGKGLCRFTPSKELLQLAGDRVSNQGTFRNYSVADGLPAQEMSNDPPALTAEGYMLNSFFTPQGMMMFHPDSLPDNPYIPPVYITKFSLFNKEVIASDTNKFLKHTIETTKEIILSYRENVFSFSFAALNFIHPENNKYAYKLEPFDKNWNYTDASKRFANYTNIDAGTYTFKVKGSNNDGVWNETPTEIKLIITPPFWKTLWFRILLGLLVLSFLYSLYRFRLYQIIRLQNIRNKIAGDLHDEIGSTLNSISVFSEVAKNKSKEEIPELKMIGEASRRVIEAMSDIVWTINPENDSFEKIIFRMRSLTHSLMKAKKIEYSFKADETLNDLKLPMIERKNFYLIFKEALNNLVKYSNASRASVTLSQAGQKIELLIRDNGVGFDMNNIARGNGLNNMNRRAAEMKAQLAIDSRRNEGTSVQLLMNRK